MSGLTAISSKAPSLLCACFEREKSNERREEEQQEKSGGFSEEKINACVRMSNNSEMTG